MSYLSRLIFVSVYDCYFIIFIYTHYLSHIKHYLIRKQNQSYLFESKDVIICKCRTMLFSIRTCVANEAYPNIVNSLTPCDIHKSEGMDATRVLLNHQPRQIINFTENDTIIFLHHASQSKTNVCIYQVKYVSLENHPNKIWSHSCIKKVTPMLS